MRLADKITLKRTTQVQDAQLDWVEQTHSIELGKCVIIPNNAKLVSLQDGRQYQYAFEVYLRRPRNAANIPHDNDNVLLEKADGTIKGEWRVQGYCTMKQWLRLWL